MVDEAYAEFAGPGRLGGAPARRGLVVVRTLSKAFGLAGLRVGYACAERSLVREIELSRGPYKVSSIAERAATAALRHDLCWVRERAAEAVRLRARLAAELRARGFAALPSDANFVLVPSAGRAADRRGDARRGRRRAGVRGAAGHGRCAAHHRRALARAGARARRAHRGRPMRVTLFDYGAGNLHSLAKALASPGVDVRIEPDPAAATDTDLLVLPGVGAFGPAAAALAPGRARMRDAIAGGLPCLGICLGMQLLFDRSEEGEGRGLGVMRGCVRRLRIAPAAAHGLEHDRARRRSAAARGERAA